MSILLQGKLPFVPIWNVFISAFYHFGKIVNSHLCSYDSKWVKLRNKHWALSTELRIQYYILYINVFFAMFGKREINHEKNRNDQNWEIPLNFIHTQIPITRSCTEEWFPKTKNNWANEFKQQTISFSWATKIIAKKIMKQTLPGLPWRRETKRQFENWHKWVQKRNGMKKSGKHNEKRLKEERKR